MHNTSLTTSKISYFTRRDNQKHGEPYINVIYLDLEEDENYHRICKATDRLLRILLEAEIIVPSDLKAMNIEYDHHSNMYKNKKSHITLFRCKGLRENKDFLEILPSFQDAFAGKKLDCEFLDISTRFQYDETKFYTPLWRLNCLK